MYVRVPEQILEEVPDDDVDSRGEQEGGDSAAGIEAREAEAGQIYLEAYLEDMKEVLGYHFEELGHLDQL